VRHDTTASGTRLHHVGFVVRSIPEAAERFIATLGMSWDREIFHDPVQTVRVTFLAHQSATEPMLELVEPESEDSRVARFLKRKGGGLHHFCYEVESVHSAIEHIQTMGGVTIQEATPAVAFGGREIAWVCTRDMLLIEYLAADLNRHVGK
jgi:methylmalonyl-CoA/ethylmalonyl-CoA epimerase